jgi:hypothetical protein
MAHIHIINAELDEGQTAALGLVARHKRAHPRPGTIGADDEIERAGCRLFKRELITFCLTVLVGAECRCTRCARTWNRGALPSYPSSTCLWAA